MFDSPVRDIRVIQRESLQAGQRGEMRQSLVSQWSVAETDLAKGREAGQRAKPRSFHQRVTEVQALKGCQRCERVQRRIREQRMTEIELAKRPDAGETRDAKIADFGIAKAELLELRQFLENRHFAIGDRCRGKRDRDRMSAAKPHLRADRAKPVRNRLFALAFHRRGINGAPGGSVRWVVNE